MPTFTGCPEATKLQDHLVNSLFKDYWAPEFWDGKNFYQGRAPCLQCRALPQDRFKCLFAIQAVCRQAAY